MNPDCNQARVLREVSKGHRRVDVIAEKLGLTKTDTRTCLTRLRGKGFIRAVNVQEGQRGRLCEYEPVGVRCILADVWG